MGALGEKPAPVPLCQLQIPHGLVRGGGVEPDPLWRETTVENRNYSNQTLSISNAVYNMHGMQHVKKKCCLGKQSLSVQDS
jgi:hypothetical protein